MKERKMQEIKLNDLTIRRLCEEDLDQTAALESNCFSAPWKRKDFEDALKNTSTYLFFGAFDGERLAGQAGLVMTPPEADITNVAVDEAYRRQGIAAGILTKLMAAGRELGIEDYTLEVRAGNKPAISLYEKLGFLEEGRRKNFYTKPDEDAVIMWKRR